MPVIAMISGIGAGWLAAGVAACALPIAAHLIGRLGRRVAFPPAAILASRAGAGRAGRAVREWSRLALRCGVVMLIAVAFDRPVWVSAGAGAPGADTLVILDRSASMGPVFERARRACLDALGALDPSRDRAAVIAVDSAPATLLPEWSSNLGALASRVRGLAPTLERGDAAGALALARAMLEQSAAQGRPGRLVIVTDAQATQWEGADLPPGSAWVHVSPGPAPNVAVTGVEWPDGGLRAGHAGAVTVRVRRFSGGVDAPADPAVVTLRWPGGSARRLVEFAAPDAVSVASFEVSPEAPGFLRLRASVGADTLDADNTVAALAPVVGPDGVAVVGSDMSDALLAAIGAVTGSAPERSGSDRAGLVVVTGADAGAVESALANGAGVVWVIDSARAAAALDAVAGAAWSPVAPGVEWDALAAPAAIDADSARAFLGLSDDPAVVGALASAASRVRVGARARARAHRGVVAMTLDDGSPVVAARAESRVAVVLASVEGLARSPLWPMSLDRVIGLVSPGAERVVVHPGQREPAPHAGWTRRPDEGADEGPLAPAAWTGPHGRPARTVQRVIDGRESDLSPFEPTIAAVDGRRDAGIKMDAERATPIWPWLLVAALAMGAADLGWSGRRAGGR
ncbi:MAG: VWA domain-containing protein [Planctomycetota bacterium]|nr:MAG: VWA domain-containing protein [Planctomycetota bacterium]